MAPAVTKKPGRKGTKQWIKNVDISEIEQNLDELRQEVIDGGKIHERPSENLFFVDKDGSEKVREAIKRKTLVIDDIMKPKSAVEGIVSRKVKPTSVKLGKKKEISKAIKLKIERDAKKKQAKGLKPGDSLRLKQEQLKLKKQELKKSKGGYDLWDNQESEPVNPYLEPVLPKPVQKPKMDYKRPKAIPNVEITHPGNSYKPKDEDHKAAIELAAQEELKKIEAKERIDQALSYPPELDLLPDEEVKFESSEDEQEDSEVDDAEKPKKAAKKKTKADINRKKRVREQQRKEKELQEEKRKSKQLHRIKEIENELAEKEMKEKERQALRKELQELNDQTKAQRLGRFTPNPMEIQLPEEIAPSLRELKPEGNLIKDRFKSLEARNLIEPRVPVKKKRKYKVKEVEYHDYKRFK